MIRRPALKQLAAAAVAVACYAILPLLLDSHYQSVLIQAAIYTVIGSGLNLFMGYTGQISFGHTAFIAIGGYASAILTTEFDAPPLLVLVAASLFAVVVAAGIGFPLLRLRGHYLAMGTLGLGLIVGEIATEWQDLTNGSMGIAGVPPFSIGGFDLQSDLQYYYVYWLFAALAVWTTWRIRGARLGRAFRAIAADERAARAVGIDVTRTKLLAFSLSAAYASIGGSMFAHYLSFVSPELFGLDTVVLLFTMLFVGGMGTTLGPLLGAVSMSLLPELLRGFSDWRQIIYGVLLLLILLFAPRGLSTLREARIGRWLGLGAGPGQCAMTEAMLEISGLTKRFGGITAVDNVSMSIGAGEIAAVIGPNGAGKTTLFNLVTGFIRHDEGSVRLGGEDVSRLRPDQLAARGLVRTFQLVRPFPDMTVRENILVGSHLRCRGGVLAAILQPRGIRADEKRLAAKASEILELVGLAGKADQLAIGLTYGQQRLLEVARGLASEPRLLLLDEPAAGLNQLETEKLGELIREICRRGVTVLFIEHDMNVVMKTAGRITVLNFGRKIAEGTPEHIQKDAAVLEAYLGA